MRYLALIIWLLLCLPVWSADNIKTIGASGADYTTIALWEDDLDDGTNAAINTTAYGSGDVAIGQLIDSSYSEHVTIDEGGTVGLSGIVLQATTNKHDGTMESGTVWNVAALNNGVYHNVAIPLTLEDIEFRSDLVSGNYSFNSFLTCFAGTDYYVRRCFFSCDGGNRTSGGTCRGIYVQVSNATLVCVDSVFYKITRGTGNAGVAIEKTSSAGAVTLQNCTAVDCYTGFDIDGNATGTQAVQNCIAYNSANVDFAGPFDTNTTNYSSDGTVSTTTTSQTEAQLFEDVANGDFTPASGSDLVDSGTDLGTTNEVNVDVFQYDRDSGGVTWDVGAAELQSSSTPMLIFMQQYRRR